MGAALFRLDIDLIFVAPAVTRDGMDNPLGH